GLVGGRCTDGDDLVPEAADDRRESEIPARSEHQLVERPVTAHKERFVMFPGGCAHPRELGAQLTQAGVARRLCCQPGRRNLEQQAQVEDLGDMPGAALKYPESA